jgi:hypothetical protein
VHVNPTARFLLATACLLVAGLAAPAASACAVCGAGDPTLTVVGSYLPFAVRDKAHAGDSFRTTGVLQIEATPRFAARLGASTRIESTGEDRGSVDPNSGGFVGYVSTELVATPFTGLHVTTGAYFPVIQLLRGAHRETAIGSAGLTCDF